MSKIDSKPLFYFYLKTLNNAQAFPFDLSSKFNDTLRTVNNLNFYAFKDYFTPLTGAFSNYLVPNFEYLFTVGLFFSLSAINFQYRYVEKIVELINKSEDPLKNDIVGILKGNFLPFTPNKVFEFLGDNYVSQSAWVADPSLLPDQKSLIQLFMKSKTLLFIANQKSYVDEFFRKEVEKLLNEFIGQFSNFPEIKNMINNFKGDSFWSRDINAVKKVLESIANVLGTINEFIKPYSIGSKQEVDKLLNALVYLNIAQKDSKQFYFAYNVLDDEYKNLVDDLMMYGVQFSVDKNKLMSEISKNLYSTYVGILASFFKRAIKSGNLNYGDCFYFLKLYSLSSVLLDYYSKKGNNSMEYNYLKLGLKNELLPKTNLGFLLDNPDMFLSTLEVIKRIGNKVSPWVIQKSPDMPKDRTFWLRLNLWTKIYNSLDKNDPNYQTNKIFMVNKLRSIIGSYSDTSKFYSFVNSFADDFAFDSFVNNLEGLLRTIAGFPVAVSYDDPDYLFSQVVRLNFLKDYQKEDVYKSNVHNELIAKILSKDNVLNKLVLDLNDYQLNLKGASETINKSFYQVVENFYQASVFYL